MNKFGFLRTGACADVAFPTDNFAQALSKLSKGILGFPCLPAIALPAVIPIAFETPCVMSENSALAFREIITALLNEDGLFSLEERRGNARRSFVRPVHMVFGDKPDEVQSGFTRDLSDTGVGLMHKVRVSPDDIATITIGRLWDGPVSMKCRACWCTEGQSGWYQSGWQILSVDACEGS